METCLPYLEGAQWWLLLHAPHVRYILVNFFAVARDGKRRQRQKIMKWLVEWRKIIVLQALQNSSMPWSTNHHCESTTFAVLTTTPAYKSRSRVIAILTSTLLFAVKRHNNLDSNKLIVVKFSSQRDKEADNLWATQQLWASITTKDDSKSLRTHHYRKAKNFFFKVNLSQMNILSLSLFTINQTQWVICMMARMLCQNAFLSKFVSSLRKIVTIGKLVWQ